MADIILTTKLNNGTVVLAKSTKYGIFAVTYANHAQAKRKAEGIAGAYVAHPMFGRVFYVALPDVRA